MARRLGTGVREMKDAVADMDPRSVFDDKDEPAKPKPVAAIEAAPAAPVAPAPAAEVVEMPAAVEEAEPRDDRPASA